VVLLWDKEKKKKSRGVKSLTGKVTFNFMRSAHSPVQIKHLKDRWKGGDLYMDDFRKAVACSYTEGGVTDMKMLPKWADVWHRYHFSLWHVNVILILFKT
jgi:hypothetical protein